MTDVKFPPPAPDHEMAVLVLKQQLRNIEQVLGVMVEGWLDRADALDAEHSGRKLAERGEWTAVRAREEVACRAARGEVIRQLADELKAYVDTWAQPK